MSIMDFHLKHQPQTFFACDPAPRLIVFLVPGVRNLSALRFGAPFATTSAQGFRIYSSVVRSRSSQWSPSVRLKLRKEGIRC